MQALTRFCTYLMTRLCLSYCMSVTIKKRGVQDGSALKMNLPLAEMPKTGRRASLEKRKSRTLMGDVSSVRYLFQYQNIYIG